MADALNPARLTYVGHATILLELDGVTIITDPLLRPQIGHLRRRVAVPAPSTLGPIDVALLSHAHHDHLDLASLRSLEGEPEILGPLSVAGPVSGSKREPQVMAAGDELVHDGVRITAIEAEHDGRRWPWSGEADALSFLISGSRRVFFAGDTGAGQSLDGLGEVDVALLPVAGWGPRLGPGHMSPAEAAEAAAEIAPACAVPIHWGTYSRLGMSVDAISEHPARQFSDRLAELAPGIECEMLRPGESMVLDPA